VFVSRHFLRQGKKAVRRENDPRIKKQNLANVMGREPYFSGRKKESKMWAVSK
jgi:hypothetical protein